MNGAPKTESVVCHKDRSAGNCVSADMKPETAAPLALPNGMALPYAAKPHDYNGTGVLWFTAAISRNFFYYSFLRDFPRKRTSKEQYPSKNIKTFQMAFFEGGYRGKQK